MSLIDVSCGFHVVPCISMTYSIFLALVSSSFGMLFLGSGSTSGSTSPTTVLSAILGPGSRLMARPFRETRSSIVFLDTPSRFSSPGELAG